MQKKKKNSLNIYCWYTVKERVMLKIGMILNVREQFLSLREGKILLEVLHASAIKLRNRKVWKSVQLY